MTHTTSRFGGKIVLVTGGTSGMGLATAARLLDEGAHVIITGRDKARLDRTVEELSVTYPADRILGIPADATDSTALAALFTAIRTRHGRLDAVFANAGIGAFQSIGDVTEAEFARVVDGNLKATFFTVQQALPLLADGGAVLLNASFAVHHGVPGTALYTATKAAVLSMAPALAAELAPRRIRVNSISPGYTDTPAYRAEASEDAQAGVGAVVAAGRVGTPSDIAAAVAFLLSDDASYINGQDIAVDGGLTTATPAQLL
ncbi:SDR family NAD(P)-dependent oxidoreductase [Yinghuangia soli]|uniref:Glucose 1-dehydrogenase n=1 Tax=Yinghuangia soli TaxID=2908204 RepID=A0AA41PUV1_9ACTN|nr:glucose 1-dehydrogenase [Yinghuangia soli]MCF2526136.1 glucose 1-dehydrogenase [Yinghuangia soli]